MQRPFGGQPQDFASPFVDGAGVVDAVRLARLVKGVLAAGIREPA